MFLGLVVLPGFIFFMFVIWRAILLMTQRSLEHYNFQIAQQKMKQIENMHLDYRGQSFGEKVLTCTKEIPNPMRRFKENEIEQLRKLNQKIQEL